MNPQSVANSTVLNELAFDFEDHIKAQLPSLADAHNPNHIQTTSVLGLTHTRIDPKHRSVVCTHWLSGLCQRGSDCDFLHKLEMSKMSQCKHGNNCKVKNCLLLHQDDSARPECIFYKQGFCFHGPTCKNRHIKSTPDLCPTIANFKALEESNLAAPLSKKRKTQAPNAYYKISLCKHWLKNGVCPFGDECHFSHGENELKKFSGMDDLDDSDVYDPVRESMKQDSVMPWAEDANIAYFMVHSPDLRSLVVSRRRRVWMLPVTVALEVNKAMGTSEKVILFFFCKPLGGLYGFAQVMAPIPPPPPGYPISPEFPVMWLRTSRLSLQLVSHLKMDDGGSLARTSYDGLLNTSVGMEMVLVLLRKQEWDWSKELAKAESGKFDSERFIEKPIKPDILFGQKWVERAMHMMSNIEEFRAPNASAMGNFFESSKEEEQHFYAGSEPGFIVGCAGHQLDEVFTNWIMGLSMNLERYSNKVKAGTPLYLLDVTANRLFGLFEALGPPVKDFIPGAFTYGSNDGTSLLPLQFPFRVVEEVPVLSVSDPEVKEIFSSSGTKVDVGPISLDITKKLSSVFAIKQGIWSSNRAGVGGGQQRNYSGTYRPPFDNIDNVEVGIPIEGRGNFFPRQLRQALLGQNARRVLQVIHSIVPEGTAKARLRGMGSGYQEGPNKEELPVPMHFTVSCQDASMLQQVCIGIKRLCEEVRKELGA
jgi:cleavage and polyadenylation specificity factor subunit 4